MGITISEYIEHNKLCNECIFEDYNEFLKIVFANRGVVNLIVWFDYCKIEKQSESLGAGGYIDKQDSTFMWAETQIYENGFENQSMKEILEYIESVIKQYPEHKLYPAFYVTE